MNRVNRLDVFKFDAKPKFLTNGFLKISGNLTRAGILKYHLPDGSIQKEFRPPGEVGKQDSINTLFSATVTDLHPSEGIVTSKNAHTIGKGHVTNARFDNDTNLVKGHLMITHEDMINKIRAGKGKELSPGYTCVLDPTPGEYNGERYDAVQRDIQYNHLAIGPDNWGRSGSEVAIRVDGDANACFLDNDDDKGEGDYPMEIKIDGAAYPVEGAQRAYDLYVERRDTEEAALVKERDELKGKLDAKDKELGTAQAELKEAKDPVRLDNMIQERTDLETKAKKVLGDEADLKGKTNKEIKVEVLKKLDHNVPDDASDGYLEGLFAGALKSAEKKTHLDGLGDNVSGRNDDKDDDTRIDSQKSKDNRAKHNAEAWKQPCSMTKEGA